MRVTPHAKYPGKAPTLDSTRAPLLVEKYSGRNHTNKTRATAIGATAVNDPGNQAETCRYEPMLEKYLGFRLCGNGTLEWGTHEVSLQPLV